MNRYDILKNKHQERFNSLPIGFAFSNEQFKEMMQKSPSRPLNDRAWKAVTLSMFVSM